MKDTKILSGDFQELEAQNEYVEVSDDDLDSVTGGAFMGNLPIAINFANR